MDVTADLDTSSPAPTLFDWVSVLDRYPQWLDIVARAEPAPAHPDDHGPAWAVDLRGRLGPLARSKRLRMVRTVCEEPNRVVFERVEHDGRSHSAWRLEGLVVPVDGGARLVMGLHYGGSLWGPVLERMLGDEIAQSRQRLLTCLATSS